MNIRQGSFRLFRFSGIDVFLHWSWFLVAAYEIQGRTRTYSSLTWNVLEYLALFLIVLLHEFGHALACRQVGGNANQIVLWPLGGVAYVDPPPRPGATLWSIAAGPLVNVVLFPILLVMLNLSSGLAAVSSDAHALLWFLTWRVDLGLLIFNILPIYPLDGGQIVRSLLWFVVGRARSLMLAAIIGFVGAAGFIALALWNQDVWLGAISIFVVSNCWNGFQQARALSSLAKIPRRDGFACPWCKAAPPVGEFWRCGQCNQSFDTFQTHGACPQCRAQFAVTRCLDCGHPNPMSDWMVAAVAPSKF